MSVFAGAEDPIHGAKTPAVRAETPAVPSRRSRPRLAASALALTAAVGLGVTVGCGSTGPGTARAQARAAKVPTGAAQIVVGRPQSVHPIQAGFLGLSLEFNAIEPYAGTDPRAVNPVLVQLIRNLANGQRPVIRIGGDTTDRTWWPVTGMARPGGVRITLNNQWLGVTRALAQSLDARLTLGVNLETDSRAIAQAEAHAFVSGIGARYVDALEPGNEPELYPSFTWYVAPDGAHVKGRPPSYTIATFTRDFANIERGLPGPIAGPSIGGPGWRRQLGTFLRGPARLNVVTLHRYPLQLCFVNPQKPTYPTIPHLLSPPATSGLAQSIASQVRMAHAHGLPVRIDEMNTISCGYVPKVGNSFATALWAVDALFAMAHVGVDGVNMHSFPGSTCALFSFRRVKGSWQGKVEPEYYGLMLFAQAAPPGSRLLHVSGPGTTVVRTWATRGVDGLTRVMLINEHSGRSERVALPASELGSGAASVERLEAPSLGAQRGIKLGGASFGTATTTGQLRPTATSVTPTQGYYVIDVAPGSAALVTGS
ncbi:MAG TPA: glycosyl hydrolase family 79 C-terminal domain-containing protein [Solirubrobacteraceae bacterium]|nr:glycosyl hydrolase family 79 C-terminal domain-containing protein [Solirubrobacteraceae bacterium]